MSNKIDTCFCLQCNAERKVGKNAHEVVEDGICYIVCDICQSELYDYKVSVKKTRNKKADHKSHS